jgi:diaminopimelate decarboxylase
VTRLTLYFDTCQGDYSKFGVGLQTYKKEIFKAYADRPWLNGIHVHVGSQGKKILYC